MENEGKAWQYQVLTPGTALPPFPRLAGKKQAHDVGLVQLHRESQRGALELLRVSAAKPTHPSPTRGHLRSTPVYL